MYSKPNSSEKRIRRHTRVRKTLRGTAERPRLCVFRSNKHIEVQIIDDVKGITLVHVSSDSLHLANGSNIEAATTVGKEIASRAKTKKIKAVVFDRGGYIYTGRVKAVADAARAGGLDF